VEPTYPKVGRKVTLKIASKGVIESHTDEACQLIVASNTNGHYCPTSTYSVAMFSRSLDTINAGLDIARDGLSHLSRVVPKGALNNTLTSSLNCILDMRKSCHSINPLTGNIDEQFSHFTESSKEDQPKKRRKYATEGEEEDLDAFRPKRFQCLCGKQLGSEDELTNHQKDNHVNEFQCLYCPKTFKKGRSAWNHYLRENGLFKYKCTHAECTWGGTNEYGSYIGHLVNQHEEPIPDDWPWKCENENCKVFLQQRRFVEPHKRICDQRHAEPLNCPGCKKKFTTRPSLLKHFACYHDGEDFQARKYMYKCLHKNCRQYGKYFTQQPSLREHVLTDHGNGVWDKMIEKVKPLFVIHEAEIEDRIKQCYEYYNLPENQQPTRKRRRGSKSKSKDGEPDPANPAGDDPAGGSTGGEGDPAGGTPAGGGDRPNDE